MIEVELPDGRVVEIETTDPAVAAKAAAKFMKGNPDTAAQEAMEQRAFLLKQIREQGVDETTGAPFGTRALVGAVDDPADRLATAQKRHPGAVLDPNDPSGNQILFPNPETGQLTRLNPRGLDVGDAAGVAREASQVVGSIVGTVAGTPAGPAGMFAGGALGAAAGEEVFNHTARLLGTEDDRTLPERMWDLGIIAALESVGQASGALLQKGLSTLVKLGLRGGKSGQAKVQQAIADMAGLGGDEGLTPSMAQATEKYATDALETLVSKTPGGIGTIRRAVDRTNRAAIRAVEDVIMAETGRQAKNIDPTLAGQVIQEGVQDFADIFKRRAMGLAGKVHTFINEKKIIDVSETVGTFEEALSPSGRNLATERAVTPADVQRFGGALTRDVQRIEESLIARGVRDISQARNKMPFKAALDLHTQIGRQIVNKALNAQRVDEPLREAYIALTADLQRAASNHSEKALKAFNRSTKFTISGIERIEKFLKPIVNKNTPENVFESLLSGGKQGATNIQAAKKAMSKGQWDLVSASVLKRLGEAAEGSERSGFFSFNKFADRWRSLDDRAKDAFFSPGSQFRSDIDKIVRIAGRIKDSSRIFGEPSKPAGTAIAQAASGLGAGGLLLGGLTLNPALLTGTPALLAAMMGSAKMGAKFFTSPKIVRLLAKSTEIQPRGWGAHVGRLAGIAKASDYDTRLAIAEYTEGLMDLFGQQEER